MKDPFNLFDMLKESLGQEAQDITFEQKADSDELINSNRGKCIAILLMSVLFTIMPTGTMAKNKISAENEINLNKMTLLLKEKISLNLGELAGMSWDEVEKKLQEMSWPEIQRLLNLLSEVGADATSMGQSEAGDKLIMNELLDKTEKKFLLSMAEKYGVDDLANLSSILDKDQLTPDDYQYVRNKLKEIARRQRHIAGLYIKTRSWLISRLSLSGTFDSKESYNAWMDDNIERIKIFKSLIKALMNYERSLGK
jgi:hypothetical protein